MAVILELGPAIAIAPEPYQNFIRQQCAGLHRPLHKDKINEILSQEPYEVTLHRHPNKKGQEEYDVLKLKMVQSRGDWYLKFKNNAALLAFQLRWS